MTREQIRCMGVWSIRVVTIAGAVVNVTMNQDFQALLLAFLYWLSFSLED